MTNHLRAAKIYLQRRPHVVALRETYLDLRSFARTAEREWWSDFDPEWIDAVAETGPTYYRRGRASSSSRPHRLPAAPDRPVRRPAGAGRVP